ncbi:inorganic diphosphatase [Robiginitomaculum antarcticum]|uniref:inorganic diphosphatase n=1 Tax=Robiginitomaculum antarcticum TaxID=437507 RepID=UPI0003741B8D|nr:inorganic diphosphatase [Robiginitomaculum antarcticum]
MDISKISVGENPPFDINVIIEVPLGGEPIKYEMDKASGAMFVDRFLYTSMRYPCNYGFTPHTLSDDGDPIDVLVVGQRALMPGSVVRARPVGVLLMEDEAGMDEKIVAVPHQKLTKYYDQVQTYRDLPQVLQDRIPHFFAHYKDLEAEKWVKIVGWEGREKAGELIQAAIAAHKD